MTRIFRRGTQVVVRSDSSISIAQIIAARDAFAIRPQSFGARGDGVTDDLAAVQACFDAAAAQRVPVFIPAATYALSGTLRIPSHSRITGAGMRNSMFVMLGHVARDIGVIGIGDETEGDHRENIYLADFGIDYNKTRWGNANASLAPEIANRCLYISRVRNCLVERVYARDGWSIGIDVGPTGTTQTPADTWNPNGSFDVVVRDCFSEGARDDCFAVKQSAYVWVDGCTAQDTDRLPGGGLANGIEIEDGSRHCKVTNFEARRVEIGVQVKGHSGANLGTPKPYNIILDNIRAVNCCLGLQIKASGSVPGGAPARRMQEDKAFEGVGGENFPQSAVNISVSNFFVIAPLRTNPNYTTRVRAMELHGYTNILMSNIFVSDGTEGGTGAQGDGIYLLRGAIEGGDDPDEDDPTDPDPDNIEGRLIDIRVRARRIMMRNVVINGFHGVQTGIRARGTAGDPDNRIGLWIDGLISRNGPRAVFQMLGGNRDCWVDDYYIDGDYIGDDTAAITIGGSGIDTAPSSRYRHVGKGQVLGYDWAISVGGVRFPHGQIVSNAPARYRGLESAGQNSTDWGVWTSDRRFPAVPAGQYLLLCEWSNPAHAIKGAVLGRRSIGLASGQWYAELDITSAQRDTGADRRTQWRQAYPAESSRMSVRHVEWDGREWLAIRSNDTSSRPLSSGGAFTGFVTEHDDLFRVVASVDEDFGEVGLGVTEFTGALRSNTDTLRSPESYGGTGLAAFGALYADGHAVAGLRQGAVYDLGTDRPGGLVYGPGTIRMEGTNATADSTGNVVGFSAEGASIYAVPPIWAETANSPGASPGGTAKYYNVILAPGAGGLFDTGKSFWRSTIVGHAAGNNLDQCERSEFIGSGAGRFARLANRVTALGTITLSWLGAPDQQWLRDSYHDFWLGANKPGDPGWDFMGMETRNPGIGTWLDEYDNYPTSRSQTARLVALGRDAGLHVVRDEDSVYVGYQAGTNVFEGEHNVAVGSRALRDGVKSKRNVGVGRSAGYQLQDGTGNTFIGDVAGDSIVVGSDNVIIGRRSGDFLPATISNTFVVQSGEGTTPLLVGDMTNRRLAIGMSPSAYSAGVLSAMGSTGLLLFSGADTNGSRLRFYLSDTTVADEQGYGTIDWYGTDNQGVGVRAKINAQSVSTLGATKIVFSTQPSSTSNNTPVDRFEIWHDGGVRIRPQDAASSSSFSSVNGRLVALNSGRLLYHDGTTNRTVAFIRSGTTAERPASDLIAGQQYFDTTLGQPIWWSGSAWVDAMGGDPDA